MEWIGYIPDGVYERKDIISIQRKDLYSMHGKGQKE